MDTLPDNQLSVDIILSIHSLAVILVLIRGKQAHDRRKKKQSSIVFLHVVSVSYLLMFLALLFIPSPTSLGSGRWLKEEAYGPVVYSGGDLVLASVPESQAWGVRPHSWQPSNSLFISSLFIVCSCRKPPSFHLLMPLYFPTDSSRKFLFFLFFSTMLNNKKITTTNKTFLTCCSSPKNILFWEQSHRLLFWRLLNSRIFYLINFLSFFFFKFKVFVVFLQISVPRHGP